MVVGSIITVLFKLKPFPVIRWRFLIPTYQELLWSGQIYFLPTKEVNHQGN